MTRPRAPAARHVREGESCTRPPIKMSGSDESSSLARSRGRPPAASRAGMHLTHRSPNRLKELPERARLAPAAPSYAESSSSEGTPLKSSLRLSTSAPARPPPPSRCSMRTSRATSRLGPASLLRLHATIVTPSCVSVTSKRHACKGRKLHSRHEHTSHQLRGRLLAPQLRG